MHKSITITFLALAVLAGTAASQQQNSSAATMDLNSSTLSGSAPYSVSVQIPGPLSLTVSGGASLPFVVIQGAGVQVGARTFFGLGTLDVGPMQTVILDGYMGPTSHQIYNTGAMGSANFTAMISGSTSPTGTPFAALQVAIIDFTNPPFYASLSAATELTVLANAAPTADAGSDQTVLTGATVTLDATGSSDPEAASLTYSWVQTGGATVVLSSSSATMPTFTAPAGAGLSSTDAVLVFSLMVNDGVQNSVADTVNITVNVSFNTDIVPLFGFASYGCIGCHGFSPFCAGSGGGMCLDGSNSMSVYDNASPRVNTVTPANSLLLLKPLAISGGGVLHSGGDFFLTTADPNYVMILTWITQGAQDN